MNEILITASIVASSIGSVAGLISCFIRRYYRLKELQNVSKTFQKLPSSKTKEYGEVMKSYLGRGSFWPQNPIKKKEDSG